MPERSGAFDLQMLDAALQTAVGAIIIIDPAGLVRTTNAATEKIFGYAEGELLGQNVNVLMPEPFRSRHDGYIRHHLETGENKIIGIGRQVMGRRKNGSIFPIHLAVSAFETDGSRYFTGIVHDLSSQGDTHVLREQALFEAIFNHLPEAALVVDPASNIMLCNPAVTRVFGYAPEELIGKTTDILYHDLAESQRVREIKTQLSRDNMVGEPLSIRFKRKSGEAFPAETIVSVLRDQDGAFVGFVLLNRDISKQVVQEEALRKSQRMEAIGQLTGGIAHDFNNLLTIITGNHELLEADLANEEQRDLLARANNAALMGARLTNRLLTFARRRRLDPAVLDLNEQVLTMSELLRRTLGEPIALSTRLAPGLWPVRADASEVENAVLNLAINGRDAMPTGGKLVIETKNVVLDESDVAAEIGVRPGRYVRLSVSDTGGGMSAETQARVFEPFFTTKGPGKGTGLGLSVIYGFVKQSEGHVTLYSELAKGTTVNVYLPSIAAIPERGGAARSAPSDRAKPTGEQVLLVEDNAEVRRVTVKRLSSLGYAIVEAETAHRAIELLQSGTAVDVIFSDVVMPGGMSGFDLAEWVQANRPNVPVLLTSGFADDVARAGHGSPSQIDILRKPYSSVELARALRKAIGY